MKKILFNGFKFFPDALEPFLKKDYDLKFYFPKPGKFDFIKNYLNFKSMCKKGKIDEFDIIHINNWENFFNIKYKKPHQIWIAHSHGIHIGLNDKIALSQSSTTKKLMSLLFYKFIIRILRKSIKKFDIYLVAIPNALKYAKMIRKDAIWLPNPISESFFEYNKNTKIKGKPVVFMPSRFHPIKNPEFGLMIFEKIKMKYPEAILHIIEYGSHLSQDNKYKNLIDKYGDDLIKYKFMNQKDLINMYKSADVVLGSFYKKDYYANLNLVELEAMASGAAVVSHDKYEFIKKDLDKLPEFTLKLLKDDKFRLKYIKDSKRYVKNFHSAKKVAKIYKSLIKT